MRQLGDDPMTLAARALERGVEAVCVTLGPRGAVYIAAGGFRDLAWAGGKRPHGNTSAQLAQTALVHSEAALQEGEPTGCGDVFGAACCVRLLAGAPVPEAVTEANAFAARNAAFRGASGLVRNLRGELVAP